MEHAEEAKGGAPAVCETSDRKDQADLACRQLFSSDESTEGTVDPSHLVARTMQEMFDVAGSAT